MEQRKTGIPMIRFRCQNCGRRYGAPQTYIGRNLTCKACGQAMVVTEDVSDWLAAVTAETQQYEAWVAEHPEETPKADAPAPGAAGDAATNLGAAAMPTSAESSSAATPSQRPKPRPMPRREPAGTEAAALWKGPAPEMSETNVAAPSLHDSHFHNHDGQWDSAGGIPSPAVAPRQDVPVMLGGTPTTAIVTVIAEPRAATAAPVAPPTAAPGATAAAPATGIVPSPTHASPDDGVRAYRRVSLLTLIQDVTVTALAIGLLCYLALQHFDAAAGQWHLPPAPQRWIELGIAAAVLLTLTFNVYASQRIARALRKHLIPPAK